MDTSTRLILVLVLGISLLTGFASNAEPVSQGTGGPTGEIATGGADSDDGMASAFAEHTERYHGSEISQDTIASLNTEFDSIKKAYEDGLITELEHTEKMYAFDDKLRDARIYVPYRTLDAYAHATKTMTKEDRKFLRENADAIQSVYREASSSEAAKKAHARAKKILKKHKLNLDEVLGAIGDASYIFAFFKAKGTTIEIDKDRKSAIRPLDSATMEKFIKVGIQIRDIVPANVWPRVSGLLFTANPFATAYAEIDDLSSTKFRIGLDVHSMLDTSGKLAEDKKPTIVHEVAHIITLNHTQLSAGGNSGMPANTTAEFLSQFKEHSYMSVFFSRFWKSIYKEYLQAEDPVGFYDKYEDRFVSDYAAIAPQEDIAESFRVFVTGDEPTSDNVKDQKVRFFYEFQEFRAWRKEIRKALSLPN